MIVVQKDVWPIWWLLFCGDLRSLCNPAGFAPGEGGGPVLRFFVVLLMPINEMNLLGGDALGQFYCGRVHYLLMAKT